MTTAVIIFYVIYAVVLIGMFFITSNALAKYRGRKLSWVELFILACSMPIGAFVILLLLDEVDYKED